MLKADNEIRWNSTWNIFHIFQCQKEYIEVYMNLIPELMNDKLIKVEWKNIDDILQLLKSFKKLIILREEYEILYKSINSTLWEINILLALLENEKKKNRFSKISFQVILKVIWKKLDKYYKLIDKSIIYIIAIMLNSCMKYNYFERNWRADWLTEMRWKMWIIFNQYRLEEYISILS